MLSSCLLAETLLSPYNHSSVKECKNVSNVYATHCFAFDDQHGPIAADRMIHPLHIISSLHVQDVVTNSSAVLFVYPKADTSGCTKQVTPLALPANIHFVDFETGHVLNVHF